MFFSKQPLNNLVIQIQKSWTEIKDDHNGDLVSSLKLNFNETVNVSSKSNTTLSKFPLLNDDQTDVNDRLKFVFNELFDRYCIDDPDG